MTSQKEFFRADPKELQRRGYFSTSLISAEEPRYTESTIRNFIAGRLDGDLRKTFFRIHSTLTQYVDFSDPRAHVYLAAWILGTYFHPIFNYYPYLHFTGTKNVGKSKTMKLMSCLSFNGIMSVSVTNASQFRIIEALRPTLFLDESEDLNQKGFTDRRALLLGGYEAGSSVLRTEKEGDGFRVRRLANYSPRAFASIEGLEDTLASRTVQIAMQRSYDDEIKQREVNLNDPAFQEIRDELFLVTMTSCNLIKEIYERAAKPEEVEFGDREFNLFRPILTIGKAVGLKKVIAPLIDFANACYHRKIEDYNTTAPENVLLRYLLENVTQDGWFQNNQLHEAFIRDFIKPNGIDLHMYMTKAAMGSLMHKMGIVSESRRSPDRTCTLYYIKAEMLKKVAENYQAL